MIRLPVVSPLKKTESLPTTNCEAINCEDLHSIIFITFLKGSLQLVPVWTVSLFSGWVGLSQNLQWFSFKVMSL